MKPKLKEKQVQVKLVEFFNEHYYKVTLPDGKEDYYPSVTTKLEVISSPFLGRWRGEIGNEAADRRLTDSQDRGSRIHKAFETKLKHGIVIYNNWRKPKYTRDQIDNFKKINELKHEEVYVLEYEEEAHTFTKLDTWLDRVKAKVIYSEQVVYSKKHREAGTLDSVMHIKAGIYSINGATDVKINGGNYLVDLKTGKSVSDTNRLQIAAYYSFVKEMGLCDLEGAIILHTSSKNKKGIEGIATLVFDHEELEANNKIYRHAASIWDWQNESSVNFTPTVMELPTIFSDRQLKRIE